MRREYSCAALAALLLVTMACSDDDQTVGPRADMAVKVDQALIKYDHGKAADWWVPPKLDGGGDAKATGDGGGTGDTGVTPDSGPPCSLPSGVSCSPACTTGQLCSAAKGGMCAAEVVLAGPASNAKALKVVGNAYASCWVKNPAVDTLCSTLNTCAMTGTLTVDMVRNWVCKTATASDFASKTLYDKAQDVCGCSGLPFTNNTKWKIASIVGGSKAKICISFDNGNLVTKDYINVDQCANFPPK